jgi:Ca2+-binding RTX toxin-like protein
LIVLVSLPLYVVDNTSDVVTEVAGEGTDTIRSSVTLASLAANVENLTLLGSASLSATGNALDNVLIGNAAGNVMTGNAGNDTLDGASGADTLIGGTGADTYRFGAGDGVDTLQENDTTLNVKDAIQFTGNVKQADVQFKQTGNNLEVLLNGTLDKLVIQNWYLGSQYHVEEFRFTDNTVVFDSQVQNLVNAMAVFTSSSSTTGGALEVQSMHLETNSMFLASSALQ